MSATDSERASFHEAGHAVAYHVLGLGVSEVSIKVDHVNRTAGTAAAYIGATGNDEAIKHAIACLAGPYATRRWDASRADWQDGADSDFQSADKHIEATCAEYLPFLSIYALRHASIAARVRAEAERIVECYWREITRVADALALRRELSGAAVVALCEPSEQRYG